MKNVAESETMNTQPSTNLSSLYCVTSILLLAAGCTSSESLVLAKVNGTAVTAAQLKERLSRPSEAMALARVDEKTSQERKAEIVKSIVDEEVVLQAALKDGLLQKSERLRREVMREYLQTKVGGGREEPSEEEILKHFEKHKADIERVRLRQILIRPTKPGDVASETAAKKKLEGVLASARKEGNKATFSKLAEQFSQDETTKNKGGDMGEIKLGQLVPEVVKALEKLQIPGDISDVVSTSDGFAIFQLVSDRRGFELNRNNLRMSLAMQKKRNLSEQILNDLRNRSSVKTYDKAIARVENPPAPVAPALPETDGHDH